ncbi:heat shock protein HspQ [Pelagibacteraceae bacterium]|jgi:heat shock protein HspQ|nr:heat shock protein HspQ [Pelagibacteraceae bacterium]MDA9651407.1 heat shock protein HspQ [Pelagibacteraceae bacterium]|tara:strand:- start:458 stop:781 length:324 start_codon:yes stop_codon:yes gene_type:complete
MDKAKFEIGQIVKHRYFDFRGVIFDVDPEFDNTEEWYQSIPAQVRPKKDQPFYHLLAESPSQPSYIAYVSQQNLLKEEIPEPITHPLVEEIFTGIEGGKYISRAKSN